MATVELHDGHPVLVRTGGDALRDEAKTLQAIAGPGVPVVVAVADHGQGVRLLTSLAPTLRLAGADVATVAATIASVLSRAHANGIVHGPLREEHLLDAGGTTVLDGWSQAGPGDPAADVAELGRLIQRLADGDRELLAIAARATAPDPPTMAALASSLATLATPRPTATRDRQVPVRTLGVLAAAALIASTAVLIHPWGHRSAGPLPAASAPTASATAASSSTSSLPGRHEVTTSTTRWPAHRFVVEGNVVERDGQRWMIGRPGDVVVIGDFDCDGEATPAVLRPSTGQVWSFSRWSPDGSPVTGTTLATVPGATTARVEAAGRCDRLEIVDASGQSTAVG